MHRPASTTTTTTPTKYYFSRRVYNQKLAHLPVDESSWIGAWSPLAFIWGTLFLVVPLSYVYIAVVLLREACRCFPVTVLAPIAYYAPFVAKHVIVPLMQIQYRGKLMIEYWCILEALFFLWLQYRLWTLFAIDPLEASLRAAPILETTHRRQVWMRIMDCEANDPAMFLTGWFFDQPVENISRYDVRDFVAWSMFEGRHQEHLSSTELDQLDDFCDEVQVRISLQMYGRIEDDDDEDTERIGQAVQIHETAWRHQLGTPNKLFSFREDSTTNQSADFFANLYETYRTRYEQMIRQPYEHMVQNAPGAVQDFRDMVGGSVQALRATMSETAQQIADAEDAALQRAHKMYESIVPAGSHMDKQLSGMSHAAYQSWQDAWNSVQNLRDRLETAEILSQQRQRIRQQLKGYRVMLNNMVHESTAVPAAQMARLMRRITECNVAMEHLENRAQSAFLQATGLARQKFTALLQHQQRLRSEPQRFAKYSSDPLMSVASFPLGFHVLLLGATELPLRLLMRRRGFERRTVGPVTYYFHPGTASNLGSSVHSGISIGSNDDLTPIVFVHGIGVGLIVYLPLIDALLATGRPILLPEIPYVSGFRPWQTPESILQPAVVTSTMTAMLATHGYLTATWLGHSYGTSWLAYLCKYAKSCVAAVLFLDPICFCLHVPRLTKNFVYGKPDPGTVSYILRTDMIVNFTIQRAFPWVWIALYVEDLADLPCAVLLSERDELVPAVKVEEYLRSKNVPVIDFVDEGQDGGTMTAADAGSPLPNFVAAPAPSAPVSSPNTPPRYQTRSVTRPTAAATTNDTPPAPAPLMTCTVFRGVGHGNWTERSSATVPRIARLAEHLCVGADDGRRRRRRGNGAAAQHE